MRVAYQKSRVLTPTEVLLGYYYDTVVAMLTVADQFRFPWPAH